MFVAALVGIDLVCASECRAAEQPRGAVQSRRQEQALLVVAGRRVALIEEDLIFRLALVPAENPTSVGKADQTEPSAGGVRGRLERATDSHNVRVAREVAYGGVGAEQAAAADGRVQRGDLRSSTREISAPRSAAVRPQAPAHTDPHTLVY